MIKTLTKIGLILALLTCLPSTALQNQNTQDLGLDIYVFEDPSNAYDIASIQKDAPFHKNDKKIINFGNVKKHSYWIKIQLHNHSTNIDKYVLDTNYKGKGATSIYQVDANNHVSLLHESSRYSSYDESHFIRGSIVIPFTLPKASDMSIYVKLTSAVNTRFPFEVISKEDFQKKESLAQTIDALMLGCIISLLFANFFQYLAVRKRTYLYYCLLLTSNLLFLIHVENYTFKYLFSNSPALYYSVIPLIYISGPIFLLLFLAEYLKRSLAIKLLIVTGIIYSLMMCLAIYFDVWVNRFALAAFLFSSFVYLFVFIVGLHCFVNRLPYAGHYLLAWWLPFLGSYIYSISLVTGYDFFSFTDTQFVLKISCLYEAIVFSYAISAQVKGLNNENQMARDKSIFDLQQRLIQAEMLKDIEIEKNIAIEKTKQKTYDLSSAAHDLRQPLAAVGTSIKTIRNSHSNTEALDYMAGVLTYMDELIRDINQLGGQEHLHLHQSCSINDIFSLIHQRNIAIAHDKGIALRFCASSINIEQTHSFPITRILQNLIENALRYTDHGKVIYGLRHKKDAIELHVLDQGLGIEHALIDKLQQPFRQGSQASIETEGYGLGLYIVKSICAKSAYDLTIRSIVGKGSHFIVRISLS